MPVLYMALWSMIVILALAAFRMRNWTQIMVVTTITVLVLILTNALFIQLSLAAGLDPRTTPNLTADLLNKGPVAWMALFVMPFGWLGPIVGFQLSRKFSDDELASEVL